MIINMPASLFFLFASNGQGEVCFAKYLNLFLYFRHDNGIGAESLSFFSLTISDKKGRRWHVDDHFSPLCSDYG